MKIEPTVAGYIFDKNKTLLVFHRKLQMWLPAGGHIKDYEDPETALKRETKQETGLKIILLNKTQIPMKGNIVKQLPLPFYADIHDVGGHYHYNQNYICEIIGSKRIKLNKRELEDSEWFTQEELFQEKIPMNIKNIGLFAFEEYRRLK